MTLYSVCRPDCPEEYVDKLRVNLMISAAATLCNSEKMEMTTINAQFSSRLRSSVMMMLVFNLCNGWTTGSVFYLLQSTTRGKLIKRT